MKKKPETPLPWVDFLWSDRGGISISYRKADGSEGIKHMRDADQAFAIRAVNTYALLLEAVKESYLQLLDSDGICSNCHGTKDDHNADCVSVIQLKAIKAAEEK